MTDLNNVNSQHNETSKCLRSDCTGRIHCLVSSGFWNSGFSGDVTSPGSDDVDNDGWRPGWKLLGSDVGKLGWSPLLSEQVGSPQGQPGFRGDTPGSGPIPELSDLYLWVRESIEVASEEVGRRSKLAGALRVGGNGGKVSNIGFSGACGVSGENADDVETCDW